MKMKEKYKVDRIESYRFKLEAVELALAANVDVQNAEDEINRRKENIPLEVSIGSQINQKNVTDLMRIWDK